MIAADAVSSPEGFRPKPGKPVYYILAYNRETLGDAIAGVKMPGPALVEIPIVAELRKQGFIRAEVGGPVPQIFYSGKVGDANFEPPPVPPSTVSPLTNPDLEPFLHMANIRRSARAKRQTPDGLRGDLWGRVPFR